MPKPFKLLYLVKCAPPQTFFDLVVIVYTGPNPDYEIRPRAGIKVADHWTYTDPMLKRRGDQPRLFSFTICALFNSLFLISAIRHFPPVVLIYSIPPSCLPIMLTSTLQLRQPRPGIMRLRQILIRILPDVK